MATLSGLLSARGLCVGGVGSAWVAGWFWCWLVAGCGWVVGELYSGCEHLFVCVFC